MNSIANSQNATFAKSPAPTTEVQAAVQRVEALIRSLEGHGQTLVEKLDSVLFPAPPSDAAAQCTASSPVPLASTLHSLADRLESLISTHCSVLDRLHV